MPPKENHQGRPEHYVNSPLECVCTTGGLIVRATAWLVGKDIMACVSGGDRPHLGAVALASPGLERVSTLGVLCLPEHREGELALKLAKHLCQATDRAVSLSAGLHVDAASLEEIQLLTRNATESVRALGLAIQERWACPGSQKTRG